MAGDASYYGLLRRGPYVEGTSKSDAGVYDEHGMTAELGGPGISVTAEVGWDYASQDRVRIVLTENLSGRSFVLFDGSEDDVQALFTSR